MRGKCATQIRDAPEEEGSTRVGFRKGLGEEGSRIGKLES